MIPRGAAWYFALNALLLSCNPKPEEPREKPIARVYDHELMVSALPAELLSRAKGKDSIPLLRSYVNAWVKQQVLLHKAMETVGEPGHIEQKTAEYRSNLIIYEFQKDVIGRLLDTSVSMNEIREYYGKNEKNFQLKQNIVKLRYVKLPINAPDQGKARKWFLSADESDRFKLLEYCNKNAANTFFDEDSWLSFDDLLKEIPLKNYDDETFLSNNKFVELKDDDYIYWVYILSFRIKSSVSPLEFETANIRNILINKRKLKVLEEMEESLLKDAKNNNAIEWYLD